MINVRKEHHAERSVLLASWNDLITTTREKLRLRGRQMSMTFFNCSLLIAH